MAKGPPSAVVPQYVQIAGDLRSKIKDGTYGPGSLLPSRNEIVAQYGVSAITARDALSMICHEGYAKAVARTRPHRATQAIPPHRPGACSVLRRPTQIPTCRWNSRGSTSTRSSPRTIWRLPLEADADEPVLFAGRSASPPTTASPSRSTSPGSPASPTTPKMLLDEVDPAIPWPEAVQQITGRTITTILQNTGARAANPVKAQDLRHPRRHHRLRRPSHDLTTTPPEGPSSTPATPGQPTPLASLTTTPSNSRISRAVDC